MDYKSYKAMCDSTLEQIRKSENKREELNNKLQKMYQEKSECEKSIIKTLQSQQKQFMDEKRRRAERNENILRTLERIDYQAQLLASKTERLRALKRQYERYLLSLWTTRRATDTASSVYSLPQNLKTIVNTQRPFTAKYDESPIHQSSYYTAGNKAPQAFVTTDLRPSNYLLNAPQYISMSSSSPITAHTYQNNQSHYREVPLTSAEMLENSIRLLSTSGNYRHVIDDRKSPALEIQPSSSSSYHHHPHYPSFNPQMLRHDYNIASASNDNAINIGDMNQPTTINSIYSHTDLQHSSPQLPLAVEKSSLSSIQSIYNQPQEYQHHPTNTTDTATPHHHNNNYNSSDRNMKMSKAYHDIPLITTNVVGGTVASAISTDSQPQQKISSSTPMSTMNGNRLNNNNNNNNNNEPFNPENSIHMTDLDTDDDSGSDEKVKSRMMFDYRKIDVPQTTSVQFGDLKFSATNVQQESENKAPMGIELGSQDTTKPNTKSTTDTTVFLASPNDDGNIMHQVWEKVIEAEPPPPSAASQQGSFVIPKIIVETQIDSSETTTKPHETTTIESIDNTTMDGDEKQDRDIPEKLLNQRAYEMEKHSSDESIPSSTSVSYDNLPLTDTKMSIYHYDKHPTDTNEQQPQSSVEYELRNFEDMKISSLSTTGEGGNDGSNIITCESDEMRDNNSLTERNMEVTAAAINNINDDKNQKSSSMALNDKIGEIYRKIERIEGEYYGEKGKIMENFEARRLSASSLSNDEATTATTAAGMNFNKNVDDDDDASQYSTLKQQEFNQNEQKFDVMDMRQHVNDDAVDAHDENGKNLISQNEWKSNQSEYASEGDVDGNQKNSNESQMDSQSNYNYYHPKNQEFIEVGETQQQQNIPVDYSQVYEQNQQSMFENQEYAVPASISYEDGNSSNINSAGDFQTTSIEQYTYEPSVSSVQYVQNEPGQSQGQYSYEEHYQQQEQQIENPYEHHQNLSLQQSESDANNFNLYNQQHQLESNYEQQQQQQQQSNYVETSVDDQNPSNYANDSVYYDYVGTQNQNYSLSDGTTADPQQTMYDEQQQNYTQGVDEYGNVDGGTEYYSYQQHNTTDNDNNIEGNVYQIQSNENNYNGIESHRQVDIETSNGMNASSYDDNMNAYQTNADVSYVNPTDTMQMTLENANYETQHLVQEFGNEMTTDSTMMHHNKDDESYHDETTTESSQSDTAVAALVQAQHEIDAVTSTKRDDIKLVKQLLDSESSDDPNLSRSNLLKTAIKEEVDESDFDFSAN